MSKKREDAASAARFNASGVIKALVDIDFSRRPEVRAAARAAASAAYAASRSRVVTCLAHVRASVSSAAYAGLSQVQIMQIIADHLD